MNNWEKGFELFRCDCIERMRVMVDNSIDFTLTDIPEESETILNSWLFEYQIFELVRLYKSIDWNKYTILFYGW